MNAKNTPETNLWAYLDELFVKESVKEAVIALQALVGAMDDPSELLRNAKTLSDLYSSRAEGDKLKKAIGYTTLIGFCYLKLNRFAPAAATVDLLKKLDQSKNAYDTLSQLVSKRFSNEKTPLKLSVPPNSKAQELCALVIPETSKAASKAAAPKSPSTPLFSKLTPAQVSHLLTKSRLKEFEPGQSFFLEGDEPIAFYIISEGEVELKAQSGFSKILTEGDFFGELALLSKRRRTASALAKTKVQVLEFTKEALVESFIESPELEERLMTFYFFRSFLQIAAQHPFFGNFTEDELGAFFYSLRSRRLLSGTSLTVQDIEGTKLYFVIDGELDVLVDQKTVSHLKTGHFVGEISLLFGRSRTAKVLAKSMVDILECPDYAFDLLCRQFPKLKPWLETTAEERLLHLAELAD